MINALNNILIIDDFENANSNSNTIKYIHTDISSKYTQKLMSLEELYQLFKNDNQNIFKFDTKQHISLILEDNTEISLHEYDTKMDPIFLKISTDELKSTDNEIFIYLKYNHAISFKSLSWYVSRVFYKIRRDLPDYDQRNKENFREIMAKDYNGYNNNLIIRKLRNENATLILKKIPAITYCKDLYVKIQDKSKYKGYLPAAGQLNIFFQYIDMFNHIFKTINSKHIDIKQTYWSSTENTAYHACSVVNGELYQRFKDVECAVLPFFKKV